MTSKPKAVKLAENVEYYLDDEAFSELLDEIHSTEFYTSRGFKRSAPFFLSQRTINLINGMAWNYEAKITRLKYKVEKQRQLLEEDQKQITDLYVKMLKYDSVCLANEHQKEKNKKLLRERSQWMVSSMSRGTIIDVLNSVQKNARVKSAKVVARLTLDIEALNSQLKELETRYDKLAARNRELLVMKKGAKEHVRFRGLAEKLDKFVSWFERRLNKKSNRNY